jgi:hypothetical protein
MKDLNIGLNAKRNIGGLVTFEDGFINSSITGATLRMKLSKISLSSIFEIFKVLLE